MGDLISEFPVSVIEEIGFYVYTLTDPATGKVFYVGKGTANRVFAHVRAAIERPSESDKIEKIKQIQGRGERVGYEILRHGLTENEALEVESALIDFIGLQELTNEVAGMDMSDRGRMSVREIIAKFSAPEVQITEPALLIKVNRLFRRNMTAEELYEITRGNWAIGERREKAKYALAVYRGIVREAYRIDSWEQVTARSVEQKTQRRWRFTGEVAAGLQKYVGGSVANKFKKGEQTPFRYVNC